jgi:hypothetical protein
MTDLKDIRVTLSKSNFDVTVKKIDGKLTVTDPITVKNQIQELRSLTDIPNVNAVSLVDGAMLIYNANTLIYEIRPLTNLTNLTVSNTLFVNKLSSNGSVGNTGTFLASNGSYTYWGTVSGGTITEVIAGNGLTGGGNTGSISLSVNTNYIATLTANAALYANVANFLNGKAESALAANSALYANVANFLNGKAESALAANSALYANVAQYALTLGGTAANNLSVNSAYYATIAENSLTSNNSIYAYGKQETQLNVNSAIYLVGGSGWANPGAIGSITPNTAVFTTIQHSGLIPTEGTNIDQTLTITDTRVVTTEWQNTGINTIVLPTGSYMLQMISPLNEIVTGIMSWYPNNNNNNENADEILLHRAGPELTGSLFLKVYRSPYPELDDVILQIAATSNRNSGTYTYKFRRMI